MANGGVAGLSQIAKYLLVNVLLVVLAGLGAGENSSRSTGLSGTFCLSKAAAKRR